MDTRPAEDADKSKYGVLCHACGREFDAARAAWCSCITNLRSFTCPACGACSCLAPKAYRDQLWSSAPLELSKRRFAKKAASFEPEPVPHPRSAKRPVVLVADDERVILRLASKILHDMGYTVLTAKDGAEALQLARTFVPDLVLTDALMPKMDGREVCKRLKSDPETSSIRVIIMISTFTATKYKTEAMSAYRADEYLAKPIDFKVLSELLKRLL